jgi:hypothetical protein
MTTAQLNATHFWCRVRCFGLPLYSAIAREALAKRLGLLHSADIATLHQ